MVVLEEIRGIYCPPTEHGCTIQFDLSYHGLVSGGRVKAGNASIQAMVGAFSPGYPGYKFRACSSGGGGERRERKNQRERESRVGEDYG